MALEGITKEIQKQIEAEIEARVSERLKTIDSRFDKLEKKEASLAKEREGMDARQKSLTEFDDKLSKREQELYAKGREQQEKQRATEEMAKLGEAVKAYHEAMDNLDMQLIKQNPNTQRAMRFMMTKGFGPYGFGGPF